MAGSAVVQEVFETKSEASEAANEAKQVGEESSGEESWDPLETLISNGLGWIIDHLEPLKEAMDAVTGDPDALNKGSTDYANLQKEIDDIGKEAQQTVTSGVDGWQGKAAKAAGERFTEFLEGIKGTADLAGSISELLASSAEMMKAARETIISILADIVETIITDALMYGWVPVAGQAALLIRVGEKIVECTIKAVKFVRRVLEIITKIGRVIAKIMRIIARLGRVLARLGEKMGTTATRLASVEGKFAKLAHGAGGKLASTGERLEHGGRAMETGLKDGSRSVLRTSSRARRSIGEHGDRIEHSLDNAKDTLHGTADRLDQAHKDYKEARKAEDEAAEARGEEPESLKDKVKEDLKDGAKETWEKYQDTQDSYDEAKEQDQQKIDEQLDDERGSYADDRDQPGTIDGDAVNRPVRAVD